MKVICRYGHYSFYPANESEKARFERIFQETLVEEKDYLTFPRLKGLERFSVVTTMYGNLLANQTYEGDQVSDVMKQNYFVYNITTGLLAPILSIVSSLIISEAANYGILPALAQAGSVLRNGQRLWSYQGELNLDYQRTYIYDREVL